MATSCEKEPERAALRIAPAGQGPVDSRRPGATSFRVLNRSAPAPSRRLVVAALVYPLALLLFIALLAGVGERSWLTTALLYLPRLLFALPLLPLCLRLRRRRAGWLWLSPAAASLLLFFPLGGLVLPGPGRADPRAPMVRVLSYNVMHGFAGPARIAAEIDRFSPDVVLLLKLGANQEEMERLLRARYPHVELSWSVAVASRFPILSRYDPDEPYTDDELVQARFVQKVIATPIGPIAFYACHPMSPRVGLARLALLRPGSIALVERETAARAAQVRRLAARAATESIPTVIAGDSNLPGLSPLLRAELSRWHDAFREAGWGFGYTYPFHLFRWMRIDRILLSDSLRAVRFQRGNSTASDHVCVVADLQRR